MYKCLRKCSPFSSASRLHFSYTVFSVALYLSCSEVNLLSFIPRHHHRHHRNNVSVALRLCVKAFSVLPLLCSSALSLLPFSFTDNGKLTNDNSHFSTAAAAADESAAAAADLREEAAVIPRHEPKLASP